jgi:hypothetical protein
MHGRARLLGFRGHLRNFQAIKILRLQLRDDMLDSLTCGLFCVRTESVRLDAQQRARCNPLS